MNRLQLVRTTGILLILLVILSNIPYTLLIQNFGYDDILREPVDIVLTKFHSGGTQLILTWFAFSLTALLLIPASILLHYVISFSPKLRDRSVPPYLAIATLVGSLSGILQAIGLLRWVFVIPILANLYTASSSDPITRKTVFVVYQAVHQHGDWTSWGNPSVPRHQYGGVVIGEFLGQMLLIGWTLGVGLAMRSSPMFKSWIAWLGLFTTLLLLLGQSELLATVIPRMPVLETTPIGFILWEIWLFVVGISLLRVPQQRFVLKINLNKVMLTSLPK